jgi:hypothetical protein
MTQPFEDVGKAGKEYMEASASSLAAISKTMQTITEEAADYARKSFESGSAALERLVAAKSLENAFEVQMEYGKQAYEGFVAEASRMTDLCADMAKEAYKPFESIVARTRLGSAGLRQRKPRSSARLHPAAGFFVGALTGLSAITPIFAAPNRSAILSAR